MRISDWSSDVCSSDLRTKLTTVADKAEIEAIARERYRRSQHWRVERSAEAAAAVFFADFWRCSIDFCMSMTTSSRSVRSAESRVGKECVRTCCSRWSQVL